MHIVIGLISALAGLIWAFNSLERSGFRLSSLNPFYWFRRNQWKKQYQENPLYNLTEPMDLASILLIGVAKLEGELSREQKKDILNIFHEEFSLNHEDSSSLFSSSSFLLQNENNFIANIGKVLDKSKQKFSAEQAESTIKLVERIASLESEPSKMQKEFISSVNIILNSNSSANEKWR